MARDDWFRNRVWSDDVADAFWVRLKRSRTSFHAAQYLRIQASYLEEAGQWEPALDLLDVLFSDYPEQSQLAAAYRTRAECLLALGREDDAVEAFRKSIEAQRQYPNMKVGTAFDFAVFAVLEQREELYDEITEALQNAVDETDLLFPVERFKVLAVAALVEHERGDLATSRRLAEGALEQAAVRHSGLRGHPDLGLVTEAHRPLVERLVAIVGNQ